VKQSVCKLLLVLYILPAVSFGQSTPIKQPDQVKKVRVNGVELHYLERGIIHRLHRFEAEAAARDQEQ